MDSESFDGLRTFVEACRGAGEIRDVVGVDWDRELGAVVEAAAERIREAPAILFDRIAGYPAGYRVLSLSLASTRRCAIALDLPQDISRNQLTVMGTRRILDAVPTPPVAVARAPVMQNVQTGNAVDLWKFPTPLHHQHDGGRYIGTGDSVINRDPESGYVNMATYRIQIHAADLLGLWMSPGQQGRSICEAYWRQGRPAPVVATFGNHPAVFMPSQTKSPWGVSELDIAGGVLGFPVPVFAGPITGLPIPAHAEIAIEGEVPPPEEQTHPEGPFGEWPGYYSGGTLGTGRPQLVIRVKAIYHRDDPILMDMSPHWPGAPSMAFRFEAGLIAKQIEAAGVPGVTAVYAYYQHLIVLAIDQTYAGHAKQAAMAALACASGARNGRYVVVVDSDIDPSNLQEVLWAMNTRVDPARDIDIVDECWASPLDARMPPEQKRNGPSTNSRAIFYAVRPYRWRDQFPVSARFDRETIDAVVEKYRDRLPFGRN